MNGSTHAYLTEKAMEVLAREHESSFYLGREKLGAVGSNDMFQLTEAGRSLCQANRDTDNLEDLEFVDVEGCHNTGRDDPHRPDATPLFDDHARYNTQEVWEKFAGVDYQFTAYSHFIDIEGRRYCDGDHQFDDYNGYSYRHGSGSHDEAEPGFHSHSDWIAAGTFSKKATLDADIAYYFNDEYIHIPGQEYYRGCSPAVWNYTFTGPGQSKYDQLRKRFPIAETEGKVGKGFPYSVLTPVDNLGRFWYERYQLSQKITDLGPVLHAIQDAAVPHHSSGHIGNWHVDYENCLDEELNRSCSICQKKALKYYNDWYQHGDPLPQDGLSYPRDLNLKPRFTWPIDQLITWIAFQSHDQFVHFYNNFQEGSSWREKGNGRKFAPGIYQEKPIELLSLAMAMTMFVLYERVTYDQHDNYCSASYRVRKIRLSMYLSNKVDGNLYSDSKNAKQNTKDYDFLLRLHYHYCGGNLERPFSRQESSPSIFNGQKCRHYQVDWDLSDAMVNGLEMKLELARLRWADVSTLAYQVSYQTDDDVWHEYGSDKTDEGRQLSIRRPLDCVSIPRSFIDNTNWSIFAMFSTSRRPHAYSSSPKYLLFTIHPGKPNQEIHRVDLKGDFLPHHIQGYSYSLDFGLTPDDFTLDLCKEGDDGWLPDFLQIYFSQYCYIKDENNFRFQWPDHQWLENSAVNTRRYRLITNGIWSWHELEDLPDEPGDKK